LIAGVGQVFVVETLGMPLLKTKRILASNPPNCEGWVRVAWLRDQLTTGATVAIEKALQSVRPSLQAHPALETANPSGSSCVS
jgi:hypothetical protein